MSLTGKRILVVEDDPVNMAIMAITLKDEGALVFQDPWNADTIERLLQILPIHLILLDLMLRHGISGYDIFEAIKKHPELSDIPIVVVSASDPSLEMNKARTMGFSGYLVKPIRRNSFVRNIVSILDGEPVWGSEAT